MCHIYNLKIQYEVLVRTSISMCVCVCHTHRSSSSDILSSHFRTLCCPAADAYCNRPVCSESPAQVQTHTRYLKIRKYTDTLLTNLNTVL